MFGSLVSFFFFEAINSCITFKIQVALFPSIMAVTFYVDLIVGEFISIETNQDLKVGIFLAIIWIQGFVNNLLQVIFLFESKT
jgi:hypothetical protein